MRAGAQPLALVVDASVALKWEFDDEQYVAQAVALRDDFLVHGRTRLYAPHLYSYELANGVTTAVRRLRIDQERGRAALRRFIAAGVQLRISPLEEIYDLAGRFSVSTYDASYVALAQSLRVELWTADRPLFDAVAAQLPLVRWIGEYSPVA